YAVVASALPLAVVVVALLGAIPQRASYVARFSAELSRRAGGRCDAAPAGYDRETLRGWLASLRGGRLWFEDRDDDPLVRCLLLDGLPLESSVPIGMTGGLGAHVGIHWLAFQTLELERDGSERRAEALGVRYALTDGAVPSGWSADERSGAVALLSHSGATDLVGAGCVVRRVRGSDRTLRTWLVDELKTSAGADELLDPRRLVALEHTSGGLSSRAVDASGCAADRARIVAVPREPGALEARVESETPIDVVFRAAAFPAWRVTVDGAPVPSPELVAPGFFSTRVPAGRHRVLATVSPMPGYFACLVLGVAAVSALSLVRLEHVRRAAALFRRRARATGT
ncbi:MAG TPA: hypothetical protein VF103_06690, partial [Polyangiaceae bacterium]